MRKSQTRLRPAGAAGRARERGAGRWRRAEGRRSVGGVAGSDTRVPAAPEAPSPANRGPELGAEVGGRAGESALFPGDAGQWVGKGHMGPGPPKSPPRPTQEQVSGSLLLLESGCPPPLPILLGGCRPKQIHPHTAAGKGLGPRPPAAHSLLPRRRREGGRWQARWTSKSQIHSLKGEKKQKFKKKKILRTEQCANDEAPPPRQGGGGRA